MTVRGRFPLVDKTKIKHIQVYADVDDWIKEYVPGSIDRERYEMLARFWDKNEGISDWQYMAENNPLIERLAELVYKKGKKNG